MLQNKKRKEVVLDHETIELLEFKAKSAGRNLKNYMEFVLFEKATEIEIQNVAKALEIRKALIISKEQSVQGHVKPHKQVIKAAKTRVNVNSLDQAS